MELRLDQVGLLRFIFHCLSESCVSWEVVPGGEGYLPLERSEIMNGNQGKDGGGLPVLPVLVDCGAVQGGCRALTVLTVTITLVSLS